MIEEHIDYRDNGDGTIDALYKGAHIAGLERDQDDWLAVYGNGFERSRSFATEEQAKRWIALHVGDLADPDYRSDI